MIKEAYIAGEEAALEKVAASNEGDRIRGSLLAGGLTMVPFLPGKKILAPMVGSSYLEAKESLPFMVGAYVGGKVGGFAALPYMLKNVDYFRDNIKDILKGKVRVSKKHLIAGTIAGVGRGVGTTAGGYLGSKSDTLKDNMPDWSWLQFSKKDRKDLVKRAIPDWKSLRELKRELGKDRPFEGKQK